MLNLFQAAEWKCPPRPGHMASGDDQCFLVDGAPASLGLVLSSGALVALRNYLAELGLARMALSLDIGFSGVILPIAIAMSNFLKLVARSIEQGKCLGAALDRTGFDAVRAIRHLVSGDGLQQSSDEMVLPLF